jgi:hypothetical protein
MNIKEVKTAIKVGDFVLKKNGHNKIDIKYLPNIGKNILEDDSARVYIFVVDGIIKKIGGSTSKGGIKATMSFYITAMTGSPGPVRFIIHLLIAQALKKGSKVELYMIVSPKTKAKVPGLFGYHEVEIASFKEMENFCKQDYYSKEGRYPDWNFQENHEEYPKKLYKQYLSYHEERIRRK